MKVLSLLVIVLMLLCCVGCVSASLQNTTIPSAELQDMPSATPTTTRPKGTVLSTPATEPTVPHSEMTETYISRFLTDTNLHGKIETDGTLVAPGTLPDVSRIPVADQALVGSDVRINLDRSQSPVAFLYHFDASLGVEQLAVVVSCENIPMLIVFQPELGGIRGLCEAMTTGEAFSARIASITNISPGESMYALSASENRGENAVDCDAPPENGEEAVWLVGIVGTQDGESFRGLFFANSNALEVYSRIFTRFSLNIE